MRCTCPDWSVPCKHASAVLYALAEAFDDDPFLVLAWRGRGRDELLDALRGTPSPRMCLTRWRWTRYRSSPASADFYSPGISLSRLRQRPAPGDRPARAVVARADCRRSGSATSR